MLCRLLLPAFLLALCSGCAVVHTSLKKHSAEEVRELRALSDREDTAAQWLEFARQSEGLPGDQRLGAWLGVARAAKPGAVAGKETDQKIYRAALRQIVRILAEGDWNLQPDPAVAGVEALSLTPSSGTTLDPRSADDIFPADQISFRGLPRRVAQSGLGLPCVAVLNANAPELAGQPGIPHVGLTMPVTAVVAFDASPEPGKVRARLEFIRTLRQEHWTAGKKKTSLAKDSSASLAWLITKGANRSLDLVTLFFPLPPLRQGGLIQLEPYDPDRIPVVFVHGLVSRPETWRNAVNALQEDPVIRKNYQFWLFSYPTGLPVWVSAARLRAELDRFNSELAPLAGTPAQQQKLNSKVLIGHSMGGLLSSLQIRQGGDALWLQFSRTPLAELDVPESSRKAMQDAIDFDPRQDISRIIFVATPHRGSPTALSLPARWVAGNIRFVVQDVQRVRRFLVGQVEPELRRELARPLNSIRFLQSNSPFLLSVLQLPRREEVPLHSIIGDRGRGDGPGGSDGVVPFWSSHLDDVVSQKTVPSGHGAHEHPEGIAEIARILREAAGGPSKAAH